MGSTYSEILATALDLRALPSALHDHLWAARRAFSTRFVDTLDESIPEWRDVVGPRRALLMAARAGGVEPWIDLGSLDLSDDWSTPQRQRLVRWMRDAGDGAPASVERDVLTCVARGLCAQWSSHGKRRPRADWLVAVALRWGDAQSILVVFSYAWRHAPTLDAVFRADRPEVWQFAQRVAYHHSIPQWRDAARQATLDYATRHGHSAASWGDLVAGTVSTIQEDPEVWRVTQTRRLERAMNERLEWSWSAVREVVCSEHPLRAMFLSLVWASDTPCRLDERGQPRGLDDELLTSRTLTLAHPATLLDLDTWRSHHLTPQPFEQLDRAVFGPGDLEPRGLGWFVLRQPGHLHTDTLMGLLRRRRWVLGVGNDNGVISCFFRHDPSSDTTALCQLDRPLFSRRRPNLRTLSVRLVFLRGAWPTRTLVNTYYMGDHTTASSWSQGPLPAHVLSPEDVDPVTLSEVLRDLCASLTT